MKTREILLWIALIILLLLKCCNGNVEVNRDTGSKDTVYIEIPKILTIQPKPVKMIKSEMNVHLTHHYVGKLQIKPVNPNKGSIEFLIQADTIYDRVVFYNYYSSKNQIKIPNQKETPRTVFLAGLYSYQSNRGWHSGGVDFNYIADKWYIGGMFGLGSDPQLAPVVVNTKFQWEEVGTEQPQHLQEVTKSSQIKNSKITPYWGLKIGFTIKSKNNY